MATHNRFFVVVTFLLAIAAAAGVATGDAAEVDDHHEGSLRGQVSSLNRELEEGTKIHKIIHRALNLAEDATEFAGMVTNFCAENAANDKAIKNSATGRINSVTGSAPRAVHGRRYGPKGASIYVQLKPA